MWRGPHPIDPDTTVRGLVCDSRRMSQDPREAKGFADLADALREATKRLHRIEVAPAERDRLTRKLLAITQASKHDLEGAAKRLRKFLGELADAENGTL